MPDAEEITALVVDAGIRLHAHLGPGLLESVYEIVLARDLARRGAHGRAPEGFEFDGLRFEAAFRVDLLVENCVVVEIKSVESLAPVHSKQLLTYLRLMDMRIGLLMNFGAPLLKSGIRRVVNGYKPSASSRESNDVSSVTDESGRPPLPSRLRVNQTTQIIRDR